MHRHVAGLPILPENMCLLWMSINSRMIVRLYPLILPLDAVNYVNAGDEYITVLGVRGHRHFWKPNQLLWEVIARKQTVWDEDEDDSP
ncbi:hypothetical protein D0Y65_038421 [Glycine soja]|uniref:Uncharacterized protein n=1 Tax=Glycine soja TaxID=3848 RepID=A0A445H4V1_GLYSO|nr:hypothetical protein D0Y65_038421 [Glycine soja]